MKDLFYEPCVKIMFLKKKKKKCYSYAEYWITRKSRLKNKKKS